ncbi:MAG: hypothetical protein ACK5XU_17695 [Pseudomonadota bacterium]|jgi:hypothetical protein
MPASPSALHPWVPLSDLPKTHPELAPTVDSARWQRRVNQAELLKHEAISRVAGRVFVHPERWAAAALEAGTRALALKAQGSGK